MSVKVRDLPLSVFIAVHVAIGLLYTVVIVDATLHHAWFAVGISALMGWAYLRRSLPREIEARRV